MSEIQKIDQGSAISILIVDDHLNNLRTLSALLQDQGYLVRKALNGRVALETVARACPDLVLLDILMPEMDGYEVCQHLKANPHSQHIPVLFLSALDREAHKLKAFSVGGADYIAKPFSAPEVLARVRHQVQILEQQRSLRHEIAERRRTEAALRRQNQTLTDIFTAIPERIIRLRHDGTLLSDSDRSPGWETVTHPNQQALPWPSPIQKRIQAAIQKMDSEKQSESRPNQTLYYQDQGLDYKARITTFQVDEALVVIQDITAQLQLQRDTAQRSTRERLLTTITEQIHRSLEIEDILTAAVEGIQQLLQINRVLIYQFNADGSGAVIIEAVDRIDLSIQGQVIYDPCFESHWNRPYLDQQYVHAVADVPNAEQLTPCYRQMLEGLQVQANLVVPIYLQQSQAGQPLWGLLIAHHCDAPHHWHHADKALIQQLAAQIAVAVQRTELYAMVLRQAHREALLNRVMETVRESLDLDTILNRTAEELRTAFQASRSVIILCEAADINFTHGITATATGVTDIQGQVVPLKDNPHAQAVLTGTLPIAVDNVQDHPLLKPVEHLVNDFSIKAMLAVAIRYEGEARGMLCVQQCDRPHHWTDDEQLLIKEIADQLAVAIRQASLYRQLAETNHTLEKLVNLDGLTQVANRRCFDDYLATMWRQQRRNHGPISLILCDVDHFKRYNDSCGHINGDDCLKRVAAALAQTIQRPTDLVARYGGEEFVLVLPQTTPTGALHLAAQIQRNIAALAIPHPNSPVSQAITLSMGISSQIPRDDDEPTLLINNADTALYRAKNQGRNRFIAIWPGNMERNGAGERD